MIETDAPLLSSLPEAAVERIDRAAQMRRAARGETIVCEGEIGDDLFVIEEGEVEVVARDVHGQCRTLARLRQGECFGELSLLSGEPASATVTAVADTTLWVLSHAHFAAIADDHPELSRNLSAFLGERLRRANKQYLRTHKGKLVCLVGYGAAPWAFWLSYHLALSVAAHTRRKVAFLDLTGQARECVRADPPVRSFADVMKQGRRTEEVGTSVPPKGLLETVTADGQAGQEVETQLLPALERLQEDAQYVLAYIPHDGPGADPVLRGADSALALVHESEAGVAASASTKLKRPDDGRLGVALLSDQRSAPTGADMRRAQAWWGPSADIRGIIPDGVDGVGETLAEGSASRRAIDRLARSIAGLTVGLALGGGGAKGYAHIGALRALQGAGVPFDCIAGCSIGAPLAAGMAAEWGLDEIRTHLDAISRKAVRPNLPLISVLTSRSIQAELRNLVGRRRFEDLPTPAGVVAVDIGSGTEVLLRRGLVWPALMASMTYPGIYEPLRMGSRYLVDGGLLNPVPVSAAVKLGADVVISCNLSAPPREDNAGATKTEPQNRPLILRTISRSLEIMQSKIVQDCSGRADVEILPEFAEPPGLLDFDRGPELEEAGERAAERALPKLQTVLPWLSAG